MSNELTEQQIAEINKRVEAMRWCEIAVDSNTGVYVNSPVYKAVTEGRDPGPDYSSCGDLAHWMLFRLGVRSKWVNRKEHKGWVSGLNVSKLAFECPVARAPKFGEVLHRGDIMIVWNHPKGLDAHVNVVETFDVNTHEVQTWDYGQAATNRDVWNSSMVEGKRNTSKFHADGTGWVVGTRKLQKVIPLMAVLEHCKLKGELVAADDHDAWLAKVQVK